MALKLQAFTGVLLAMLVGTALQLAQPRLWPWQGYAALGVLGLLLCGAAWRWRRAGAMLLVLGVAACAAASVGLRALAYQSQALPARWEGVELQVQGTVQAMPQWSDNGQRFRFAPRQATYQGQPVALPPLLELHWAFPAARGDALAADSDRLAAVWAGQHWDFTVRLKAPHGARNPHGFDYELWLWEQGIQATGQVRATATTVPRLLGEDRWRYAVERARQQVRDAIVQTLQRPEAALPEREQAARAAGVVAALVVGDQRAIERSDWALFRTTGVAHLMSISGLHITLFAWLAMHAVGVLWRCVPRWCLRWPAPHAALVGGCLLACGYALFSGWGLPAQRTVLMLASVALLRVLGLRWPWQQVWLLAAVVVVLADPWALWQAGFWLSFVAVGVLIASDSVAARACQQRPKGVFERIRRFVREQSVVSLALAPLTLLLFGQVSVVGWLANLLAIPWVTLVVTPLSLLGLLWPPLWQLAAASLAPLWWWLHLLASSSSAVLVLPAAPLWAGALALCGAGLLVLPWPWWLRTLGLPLLLPLAAWQSARPPVGEFELLAADVGQGSAVWLRTAHHALLYDAGPRWGTHSDAGDRVLVPLLRALGGGLDTLLLSHSDSDHRGGAAAVLAAYPGASVRGASAGAATTLPPAQACVAGQRWQWDGVVFELLHPPTAAQPPAGNGESCVLRVQSQSGQVALLVGDIEQAQEQALLAQGAALRASVLLVPHHGSRTSSSPAFVAAVAPRWAVVQAGYRNRFGHPHAQVVQRYQAVGAQVVNTVDCGAARWPSWQPEALQCERVLRQRYWQHPGGQGPDPGGVLGGARATPPLGP